MTYFYYQCSSYLGESTAQTVNIFFASSNVGENSPVCSVYSPQMSDLGQMHVRKCKEELLKRTGMHTTNNCN